MFTCTLSLFSAPSAPPACPHALETAACLKAVTFCSIFFARAGPAAKLHQAAECMLQEVPPDKVDLQQACQLLDAKSSALARGQGSNADQQLQGNSADGLHGLDESKVAADDPDKQFSKAGSKAGRKAGSQNPSLKGKKQSQSDDATKGLEDKAKQKTTKAGKSTVQKGTLGDKKPKTVGADKVSSKGTSSSPPKSRYRLFWRQQWAKLRLDRPSITMTDANRLIAQDWKQLDDTARQTYQ